VICANLEGVILVIRQKKVPDVVIRRLPLYLRALELLDPVREPIISSEQIAAMIGTSSGQVRKDLSCFGVFGKQGVGYNTFLLCGELRRILQLDREVKIGLIGAGNLGAALVGYHQKNRAHQPLEIVAFFDVDPQKIGKKIKEIEVFNIADLGGIITKMNIKMIILAFPAVNVQAIVDTCIVHGVKSFLNFIPVKLKTPEDVKVQTSDVTLDLQSLAYYT
jgi:redox-sensing transcriptional repressor